MFGRWFTSAPSDSASAERAPSSSAAAPPARASSSSAPPPPTSSSPAASSVAATSQHAPHSEPIKASEGHKHQHAGVQPVEVAHGYDSPEPDLYRTFSPSEVAFWDLKSAADGNGSGFFSRLFGGGAAAAGGTASK